MNDLQIFQLMMKTPDIRAVQISDALNVELADVSRALRELVECGSVIAHNGVAPNGVQAQMYNLSDEFKRSREYSTLEANLQRTAAAPSPVVVPKFADAQPPAPKKSRVERGVECVTELGRATNEQMRKAMGLTAKDFPAAYLTGAVKAGKLYYTEQCWHPGPAPAELVTTTRGEQLRKHGPVLTITPDAAAESPLSAAPELTKAQLEDLAYRHEEPAPDENPFVPVAAPAHGATFRCGLWSDGVLELQRNGLVLVTLTRDEGEQLADFMKRMLVQVEVAA